MELRSKLNAFMEDSEVESQSISCIGCGQLWNIPKDSAEEDDYLNCCPTCSPEAWDADPLNNQGTA
jgi:hypothetical protein